MFNLEASRGERFQFAIEGDETVYTLPNPRKLPASFAIKLGRAAKEGEGMAAIDVFAGLLDDECPGLLDKITVEQMTALVEAWQAFGGITMGESEA